MLKPWNKVFKKPQSMALLTPSSSCKKSPMSDQEKLWKHSLRGLGINLLLCIGSVSIFLGGTELVARIWYAPQKYEYTGMFEYDREKVFSLRKNNDNIYHGGRFTTNSFGFRGKETSVEKPSKTLRILIVGDSIAFGHGMDNDQTFSSLLEASLNKHFSEEGEEVERDITVEVINTAVPGNAPFQEYYDLKRGLQFNPDVIVLQLTLNDIIEPHAKWILQDMGILEGSLEVVSHDYILGITTMPYIDHLLKQHSALYLFLKDMQTRIRFRDPTGKHVEEKAYRKENYTSALLVTEPDNPTVEKAWENAFIWIRGMTSIARERDIPFVLLVTPYDFQFSVEERFAYPQQKLRVFAAEENLFFADILKKLWELMVEETGKDKTADQIILEEQAKGGKSSVLSGFWSGYFSDYCHPSATGHTLIAEELYPLVLEALTESKAQE